MVTRKPIPELDQAIEAYARAFAVGDRDGTERFVAERGIETHRAAMAAAADKRPLDSFELLARAKIGFHQIAKLRWTSPHGKVLLQVRWVQQPGPQSNPAWMVVEVEDLSLKRSPWSDIPPLAALRSGNGNA